VQAESPIRSRQPRRRRGLAVGLTLVVSVGSLAAATDSRVADAAQKRDRAVVQALLTRHVDVNAPQPDGATAIAWAAHWDDAEMAELLLGAGANANVSNDFGVTPLSLACENGSVAMVERLLRAGADPNLAQATTETPLITAARTGNIDVVKTLLAHGADLRAHNSAGQTALMWSVSEGHRDVVAVLIDAGADVHMKSNGGFTPLLFAARQGDVRSAQRLIDAGADVNEAMPDGATALVLAAASGREALAMLLLQRGGDAKGSAAGFTALHAAVPKSELELVKALLAHGADPNTRLSRAPSTIFGPSGGAGSEVASGALVHHPAIQARADAEARGMRTWAVSATPFWLAAKYVNVPVMRALLAGGANPSLTADDGTTPLMAAAGLTQFEGPRSRRGDVSQFRSNWDEDEALEAVRLLLDLAADVNAANHAGQTALHAAAYLGANRIVRFLVERGANLNAQDQQGQTPFRVAQAHLNVSAQGVTHNPETAELIRQLGADTSLGVDGEDLLRRLQRETAVPPAGPPDTGKVR